jgi:isoquinoline 1-oxidoreductase subunit beta
MIKLTTQALSLPRRSFLIGMAGAGANFWFGTAEGLAESTQPQATGGFEPTIWYSIGRDGIVTVNIIRAEMGQHVVRQLRASSPTNLRRIGRKYG